MQYEIVALFEAFQSYSPMEEVFTSKGSDEKIIYNMQEVRYLIPCSIHMAFLLWIMAEKQ